MARRSSPVRAALPWLFALALVALVGFHLHQALKVSDADLIAYAESLRVGDLAEEVARDPISALHVLDPLLERDPTHFGGLLAAARAWGDLQSYGKAVELLERAANTSQHLGEISGAKRLAVHYLIMDAKYDAAVAAAQDVVDLQPANPLPPLQLGAALYRSSVASQADVVRIFVGLDKGEREIEIEEGIEAFVTDLWSDPAVDVLVDDLAPDADQYFREELTEGLLAARERFLQASDAMAGYRTFEGFDVMVAQAYTELLLRSGRIFEAHVEASIALRNDTLPTANRRVLLETVARCSLIMDEHGLAADAFDEIVSGYEEQMGWAPPRYPAALIEERVLDEDWDWVVLNEDRMTALMGDDIWWGYAQAKTALALSQVDAAHKLILDIYPTISMGTLMPFSVRGYPWRRREMLMLSHQVFEAKGDSSALSALDALLEDFPDDLDARRMRVAIQREQGFLEGAVDDAFKLLRADRRDLADFDQWLAIADELSRTRHNKSLDERAVERVDDEENLRRAALAAVFQSSQVKHRKGATVMPDPSAVAFPTQDPALAFSTIRERVRRNELERARNDARQLVQAHPQVQEFRYRLARLLVREGRHEAAVDDFRQILADVPSDTETLDLALRVESVLGNHDEAAALVNDMILADPLGVGAVRYAQLLLEDGAAQRCERLIERLVALWDTDPGLDVLTMAARAQLAQGEFDSARMVLDTLHAHYPLSEDVALLGLELGLAQEHEGLIAAAVEALRPLSAGLFPDQVANLAERLLERERFDELLLVFPEEQRTLPAVQPALRPLAEAAKALGFVGEADRLLMEADDHGSLRDRFLLLSMDGRTGEATRGLRLAPARSSQRDELDLCLMVGAALDGAVAMTDDVPTARLRDLGLADELGPVWLELFDATLRLMPTLKRPSQVIPPQVASAPLATYPRAGAQVQRLLAFAEEDPDAAMSIFRSITLMILAGDDPFWTRETRILAEYVLERMPGLEAPSLLLARRRVEQGLAKEALQLLRQVVASETPDLRALDLFLEASRMFEKEEWGVGLALALSEGNDEVTLLLADALVESGRPAEGMPFYEELLAATPDSRMALGGLVNTTAILQLEERMASATDTAIQIHPGDDELLTMCSDALAGLRSPSPETVTIMERLAAFLPANVRLSEALARAWSGDPDRVEAYLTQMLDNMGGAEVDAASSETRSRTLLLMSAASTARRTGLPSLARDLIGTALRLQPGNVMLYRELAFLELEDGQLDTARRYLEVLSFVDRTDKDPPLALARLLFEQVGQPHKAAEVIRQAYNYELPTLAVEILGAESYLRGRIDESLSSFHSLRNNPLVTPETTLDLARMAFAAGRDDGAAMTLDIFLTTAAKDHPGRPRAEKLRKACKVSEVETAAVSDGGLPIADLAAR
jgi:tetratricopeptide (TPR) repeat protein